MSVLTEEQIENLKKTHPQKLILRFIFLIFGALLMVAGVLLLLLGVDFGVEVSDINISFLIDILLIVFGMIIASKYFIAPYYLRENSLVSPLKRMRHLREPVQKYAKFNSFALSRLLAGLLFVAVGVFSLGVFGLGIGHEETRFGTAFVLGGPSFFYFTGLPALIIGISLFLYVLLSVYRGTISESENFYFFYELRPICPWLTEIPKKDIEALRYQNNHIGPKLAWVILLFPFIVMQLQTGIPLLFNNVRAAPEYVFSLTLIISSILEIVALIILIFLPQNYYEIATKDRFYEMWFSPIKFRGQEELRGKMCDLFNCGVKDDLETERERELKKLESSSNNSPTLFDNLSNTHFQLFDLVFGILLVISAIIMLTQMVLFGPMFWWVALMFGFMLLVKAFCYDFSRRGEDKFFFDEENKVFKFQRKFAYKFHYITANKVESIEVRKWYRKLDFFDIFGLGGMIIMLTIQQAMGWGLTSTLVAAQEGAISQAVLNVITDNIISTIYMAVLFIFIILYLCLPIDVIEFKTPSITYRVRVTAKLQDKNLLQKYLGNLKGFPKEIFKDDMKKTFLIRIIIFLILFLGTLIYTIITLIGYFT